MRLLALFLVLIGVAGIAFGVLDIIGGMSGTHSNPFWYETYGGPGPIIAGLILVFGGIALAGAMKRQR